MQRGDVDDVHPASERRDSQTVPFFGGIVPRSSLEAVQYPLREISPPRIPAEEPDARIQLAEREPPADVVKEVGLLPFHAPSQPTRCAPSLRGGGAPAAPLGVGDGSCPEFREALAFDCPVDSSEVGCEGLGLSSDKGVVGVDSTDRLAAAIVQSTRNPRWTGEIAQSGRAKAIRDDSWDRLAERLGEVWESQTRPTADSLSVATYPQAH